MVQNGSGSGGDDAAPEGNDPGYRVLALLIGPGPLDHDAAAGPSGVRALEGEPASGEMSLEDGESFGGAGHGAY